MTGLSKLLLVVGILSILGGIALRITMIPLVISGFPIKPSTLLIGANTCFLLAILFKK